MYEVVGAGTTTRHTRVFAWASVLAIWSVVITTMLLTLKSFAAVRAWRQAVDGTANVSVALDLQDQMHLINRLGWVCLLVSAVALAAWSRRIAQNARDRSVPGMRIGIATFSWFVPLFGIRPAITQLRRAVRAVDYSDHRLGRWLWTAYINFFVTFFTQLRIRGAWVVATDIDSKLDALDVGNHVLVFVSLWIAVSATLATLAILHADRAVSSAG